MHSLIGYIRIHDGCIRVAYRSRDDGRVITQRKRRPAWVNGDESICTWVIPCSDHPDKEGHKAGGAFKWGGLNFEGHIPIHCICICHRYTPHFLLLGLAAYSNT